MRRNFYAGIGIENTWVAQHDAEVRPGKRLLDVFLQMQHYAQWEEDLRLAADLGVNAIRYSVPWYRANPAPGVYDWEWVSHPLEWLAAHDISPVIDLIHYGTPLWMPNGILDAALAERLADYAVAFARRFEGQVSHFTPFNEPQASAMHSGYRAWFPPYLYGVDGWATVSRAIARAMIILTQALRAESADVTLISADCRMAPPWAELQPHGFAAPSGKQEHAEQESPDRHSEALLGFFPASLAYGAVDGASPLAARLVQLGYSQEEFAWFVANAQPPDIFGVNYYPFGWPEQTPDVEAKARDLLALCLDTARFFQLPLYITETSGGRTAAEKVQWMDTLRALWHELGGQGIALQGLNWWPLFDSIQWRYRDNAKTVEECILPGGWNNGLYGIEPQWDGSLMRVATAAVPAYRTLLHDLKQGRV